MMQDSEKKTPTGGVGLNIIIIIFLKKLQANFKLQLSIKKP